MIDNYAAGTALQNHFSGSLSGGCWWRQIQAPTYDLMLYIGLTRLDWQACLSSIFLLLLLIAYGIMLIYLIRVYEWCAWRKAELIDHVPPRPQLWIWDFPESKKSFEFLFCSTLLRYRVRAARQLYRVEAVRTLTVLRGLNLHLPWQSRTSGQALLHNNKWQELKCQSVHRTVCTRG